MIKKKKKDIPNVRLQWPDPDETDPFVKEHTLRDCVANTNSSQQFVLSFLPPPPAWLVRSACGNLLLMGKKTPGFMCAFVAACVTTNRFSVPGATYPCATPTHTVGATVTLPFFALFVCTGSVTVLSPNTGLVACVRLWPSTQGLSARTPKKKKSKLFLKLCCCNSAPVVFLLPSRLFLNPISLCNHTLL